MPDATEYPANPPALQDWRAAIEQWLREEVLAVYDAMKANPTCGLAAKSVFAEARARYTKHMAHYRSVAPPCWR